MANIDFIKELNEQYGKRSPFTTQTKFFAINEALDPDNLQKAIQNSIASLGPEYTMYFDLGLPADIVMLFIDVCDFSTRFSNLMGDEIGDFFDRYYDIVIPIIYKYGGEIDKIIGDGIVCLFGPPFLPDNINKNITNANRCAKEIITVTSGTEFSSKVAFHSGNINYFKNKTGLYKEFTVIGKPLTELFRLESISRNECINYYENTKIREFYLEKIAQKKAGSSQSGQITWLHIEEEIRNLKGVNYKNFFSVEYNRS